MHGVSSRFNNEEAKTKAQNIIQTIITREF
jgi:hypothetical protein